MNKEDMILEQVESVHFMVDELSKRLHEHMVVGAAVQEKTNRNEKDIRDLKEFEIDNKIRAGLNKVRLAIYGVTIGVLVSVVGSLFGWVKDFLTS